MLSLFFLFLWVAFYIPYKQGPCPESGLRHCFSRLVNNGSEKWGVKHAFGMYLHRHVHSVCSKYRDIDFPPDGTRVSADCSLLY